MSRFLCFTPKMLQNMNFIRIIFWGLVISIYKLIFEVVVALVLRGDLAMTMIYTHNSIHIYDT